jgi:hypothetical protein
VIFGELGIDPKARHHDRVLRVKHLARRERKV